MTTEDFRALLDKILEIEDSIVGLKARRRYCRRQQRQFARMNRLASAARYEAAASDLNGKIFDLSLRKTQIENHIVKALA